MRVITARGDCRFCLVGRFWVVVLTAALLVAGSFAAAAQEQSEELVRQVLRSEDVRSGLCVQVGCGDGKLTAELGRTGKYLVHGLAADRAQVEKARRYIESLGIYGRVSVDYSPLDRLPYADNMVNLLVVDDLPGALEKGLTISEIMRVVAPYGVALLHNAGSVEYAGAIQESGWTKLVKPWPEEMDEWTQYRHNPTRAATSGDKLVHPPNSLRWIGGDYWAHRALRQTVSANGRNFYLIPNDTKRLKEPPGVRVVARDAFNGMKLWEYQTEGELSSNTKGPLIAVGDRLYLCGLGKLKALDAATGNTVKEYAFAPVQITYYKGMLIAGQGARTAYDAQTGEKLWEGELRGYDPCIIVNDRIYLASYDSQIGCSDVRTGKKIWSVPMVENATGALLCYRDGILFLAGGGGAGGRNSAYSAKDGRYLWSYSYALARHGGRPHVFFLGGLAWVHKGDPEKNYTYGESWIGLDPQTGEVRKEVEYGEGQKVKHRCYPDRATDNYILCGGMDFFDVREEKHYAFHGARGACGFGYFPANGLVYGAPTLCHCFAHVRGFSALADDPAPRADELKAIGGGRFGRGSGRPSGDLPAAGDWPTFRRDAIRSASTAVPVPAGLKLRWQRKIGDDVSSPVGACGKVYVASVEGHRVVALDGRSGEVLWEYPTGGRVDSPPTITAGMALFGCRDGWVHCVSAGTGELIWRFRAAPLDRRIISYEQVESVWPVHGSVLVMDDTAYFAAGRHSEIDGGIFLYAADPRTGKIFWQKQVIREQLFQQTSRGAIGNEMNDILSSDGKTIYMRRKRFDAGSGEYCLPTSPFLRGGTVGYLRDIARPPYGWKHESQRQWALRGKSGKATVMGSTMVWDGTSVFGLNNDMFEVFASTEKEKRLWTVKTPEGCCPKAIIRAGDKIFVAAMTDVNDPSKGEIWVYAAADGKELGKAALPAAPRFDGMAAVPGQLLASTQDGRVLCFGE